jgi:hypothetical protein
LREVVESGTVPGMAKKGPPRQQAQPGKPTTTTAEAKKAPPPKARIALKPVPPLEYDPKRDFAALLAGLATCDSGAALTFDPPLATVRDARSYDITVGAPATDKFGAPDPVRPPSRSPRPIRSSRWASPPTTSSGRPSICSRRSRRTAKARATKRPCSASLRRSTRSASSPGGARSSSR